MLSWVVWFQDIVLLSRKFMMVLRLGLRLQ